MLLIKEFLLSFDFPVIWDEKCKIKTEYKNGTIICNSTMLKYYHIDWFQIRLTWSEGSRRLIPFTGWSPLGNSGNFLGLDRHNILEMKHMFSSPIYTRSVYAYLLDWRTLHYSTTMITVHCIKLLLLNRPHLTDRLSLNRSVQPLIILTAVLFCIQFKFCILFEIQTFNSVFNLNL